MKEEIKKEYNTLFSDNKVNEEQSSLIHEKVSIDNLQVILSFLDTKSIASARLVSKAFNKASKKNGFWKNKENSIWKKSVLEDFTKFPNLNNRGYALFLKHEVQPVVSAFNAVKKELHDFINLNSLTPYTIAKKSETLEKNIVHLLCNTAIRGLEIYFKSILKYFKNNKKYFSPIELRYLYKGKFPAFCKSWPYHFSFLHLVIAISNKEVSQDLLIYLIKEEEFDVNLCADAGFERDSLESLEMREAKGPSPLHYAAFLGNALAIKILLENNASLNYSLNPLHWGTPLACAIAGGNLECVKLILEKMDPTQLTEKIYHAHYKLVKDNEEIKEYLVEKLTVNGFSIPQVWKNTIRNLFRKS